ncbi:hypothetical protein Gpo141_00007319, partial [Globisporangium polare]
MRAPGSTAHTRVAMLLALMLVVMTAPVARGATTGVSCGQTSSGSNVPSSGSDAWPQPRANALSSRCNGVCGSGALCVFRSAPLVGCDGDSSQGLNARCVNGPTCAYECLAVHAKATSWSVVWNEDEDAPTVVTITTALISGEVTVAYVSGPIESIDDLELPTPVADLSLSGPRKTAEALVIGTGSTLLSGLAQLTTLELSNVQIEDWDEVPSMPELTTLTLANASLAKWPVTGVPATLESLEISFNAQLKDALVAATFPSSLQSLTLKRCGLTQFPLSGVQALTALNYLSLDGNSLKTIAADALPTTLKYLSLRECGLDDVPGGIVDFENLGTLDLSGNPLETIATGTLPFETLSVLTLSNCSLQSFPFAETKSNELDTLDLSWNPLFPENDVALESLTSLRTLDLSYTNLSQISQAVLDSATKKISLSGNPLQEILWPSSANVLFMNVSDCGLSELPSALTKLRFLDISKNKFTTVPESVALSETLLSLFVDKNPIASIDKLPRNLTSLSAASCSLTKVPASGLENLQDLNLRENKLSSIDGLLAPSGNVQTALLTLDLRDNQFASIPALVWDLSAVNDFKFQGNPVSPKLRLTQSEVDWLNQCKSVSLDADALDTDSCASPIRLSYGYSVCVGQTESGVLVSEERSADESSGLGSKGNTMVVKAKSAEQKAEDRHAMLITGIVAVGILCAIAVGHLFVYRAGLTKTDDRPAAAAASADRSQPKPADAGTKAPAAPKKEPEASKPLETKAPSASSDLASSSAALLQWKLEGRELAMEDEIAWGRTCAVFTAMYRGQRVVVKKLLHKVSNDSEAMFLEEFRVLSQFQHAKIVQLVGVSWVKNFQKLQLVLEYMPYGDLQTYLSSIFIDRKTSQQYYRDRWGCYGSAMKIALDIAEAMEYTHTVTAVDFTKRRVLTSRQILLDDELHAKMSDFGGRHQIDNTTARWLSPEVLEGRANYNEVADVYALGVVLWELDSCDLPFAQYLPERDFGLSRVEFNDEVEVLWQRVAKGELRLEPRDDCPPMVRQLILKCLSSDPFDRPSAAAVVQTLREVAAMGDKSFSWQQPPTGNAYNSNNNNSNSEACTSVRTANVVELDSPGSTAVLTNRAPYSQP